MRKYISFSLGCLVFIDSFQFISGPTQFHHMTEYFGTEKIDLLRRKQIYSYKYLDCECKCTETQLPPKEAFYSTLSGENISVEDYAHAQCIWKDFNIQNFGQYHDLYVLTDVLSLADVFENFREVCLNYYGLDAAHF